MFLTEDRTIQPSVPHMNVVNKFVFCKIGSLPWLTEHHQVQLELMVYTESQNTWLEAVHYTECSIVLLLISCIEPKTGSLTLSKIHWRRQPCLLGGQQEISSKVSAPSMEHSGGRHIHTCPDAGEFCLWWEQNGKFHMNYNMTLQYRVRSRSKCLKG